MSKSKKVLDIAHITTYLREAGQPVHLDTLARDLWRAVHGPRIAVTDEHREELADYLTANAELAGWHQSGLTWSLAAHASEGPQAVLPGDGFARRHTNDEVAALAHALSVASQQRADAQRSEKECKLALTTMLEELGRSNGEEEIENEHRQRYSFTAATGKTRLCYWHTEPAKSEPKFETPEAGGGS